MKREIKFRGKTLKGDFIFEPNKWVFGDLLHHIMGQDQLVYNSSIKSAIIYHVDPKTVGEFIGIQDKNKVDIYEGDIIVTRWVDLATGKVDEKEITIKSLFDYELLAAILKADECEVISNIHN